MFDLPIYMRESLIMKNDPFSDFLQLIRARSVMSGGLVTGGAWAIDIPPPDKIKFWGVLRGSCWLLVEGVQAPIRIEQGDVFLLSSPRAVVMASDLAAPRVGIGDVLKHRVGAIAHHGSGDDCFVIGGNVELSADYDQLLLDALPPFIHVRAGTRRAETLSWLMNQLVQEREDDPPGAGVASTQLAHLMFIQILRAHFDSTSSLATGWLRAVTDKRIAPALQMMHAEPGRSWHLEELARASAMSRPTFAMYFKTVAGVAPMTYLTQWRMRLAKQALRENRVQIGDVGRSLGYTSESAFSNAFKRVTGHSPMHFKSGSALRLGANNRR